MPLPFFFVESLNTGEMVLDEENSKHIVGVLRMEVGEELQLTDGQGKLARATIVEAHRKKCRVAIANISEEAAPTRKTAIGISLVKNMSRFEWFLEKATEIGITEIYPLLCSRTEKQHARQDRLQGIIVSAMLQSQQCRMPVLHEPLPFQQAIKIRDYNQSFIAHCLAGNRQALGTSTINKTKHQLLLIGPEGDFTPEEIQLALDEQFIPVELGLTRLRTETAGLVGAVLLVQP